MSTERKEKHQIGFVSRLFDRNWRYHENVRLETGVFSAMNFLQLFQFRPVKSLSKNLILPHNFQCSISMAALNFILSTKTFIVVN